MKYATILILLIMFFICWRVFEASLFKDKHRDEYLSFWVEKLEMCETADEISQLSGDIRPYLIVTRPFPDGSWLAAVSTSTDSHSSFDATLIYDSKGNSFSVSRTFSGYEGLHWEINNVRGDSLAEFYSNASDFGLSPFPD